MRDPDRPPEIRDVDFSMAHFLDHPIWRCHQYEHAYGGWRTHLSYAWDLVWRPRLRAWTLCRVGRHRRGRMWRAGSDIPLAVCLDCSRYLP